MNKKNVRHKYSTYSKSEQHKGSLPKTTESNMNSSRIIRFYMKRKLASYKIGKEGKVNDMKKINKCYIYVVLHPDKIHLLIMFVCEYERT